MARSRNKKTEIEEEIEKRIPTTRYNPDYKVGLTAQQVQEHRLHGWVNRAVDPPSKTTKEIIHENVFTYFNLIFLVLAILLCLVGSFRDLTFLPVIIANTLIGIIQEIRAKQVLDKLTMLNAPRASVVRDGKRTVINAEDLVVDDIVIFKAGDQVCADAEVSAGEFFIRYPKRVVIAVFLFGNGPGAERGEILAVFGNEIFDLLRKNYAFAVITKVEVARLQPRFDHAEVDIDPVLLRFGGVEADPFCSIRASARASAENTVRGFFAADIAEALRSGGVISIGYFAIRTGGDAFIRLYLNCLCFAEHAQPGKEHHDGKQQ